METLCIFSEGPTFFVIPESKSFTQNSEALGLISPDYKVTIDSIDEFRLHLERVKIVVLVAEKKLFDPDYLAAIPATLTTLAVISGKAPLAVCEQLNNINSDGYLFGPVTKARVVDAINKAHHNKVAIEKLQQDLQQYTNIAFTAMSSASEMGIVTLFAERAQSIMDIPRLAQLALTCLKDLRVEGIVQFAFDDVTQYPENISEPYKKLMNNARMADARIVSHGRFLVFSFMHVQMMITNAPVDDAERYGRLRDVLAPIVSITEARLKTLKVNQLLKEQQTNSRMVIGLLEMASKDNRNAVKSIMTELSLALRELAMGMELTLEQETSLLKLSDSALESLEGLHENSGAIEEHFRSMLEQLDSAASLLDADDEEENTSAQDDSSSVELF